MGSMATLKQVMLLVAAIVFSSVSAKHHEDKDLGAAAGAFFSGIGSNSATSSSRGSSMSSNSRGSAMSSNSRGSTISSNSRGSAMSSKSRASAMSSDFETIPIIEDDFEEDNHNTFEHHTNMNHGFGGSSNTRKSVNKFASDSFGSCNEDRFTGSSGFSMNSHRLGPQVDNSMRVNV